MPASEGLSIGALARRTGLAVSAIRYYETQGLIAPWRNAGGQRRYQRADLRRLSFVMIAQQLGLTLPEIREVLAGLPGNRTPTRGDWTRISTALRERLNQRIATLERLRDNLDGCIGCGCLSLPNCALYNPADRVGSKGPGPRLVLDETGDL
ncbi:redox-sensitive transcriptional activator SoxR [Ruegeria pomeroyi]|uniref:Redox-sensitive transcriptional activator SoxR n=2 Tax=Ruegeria pomeroyi TaxID=89184 RepID=Q5LXA2_RUEPO|nr:redox-sensitive transcriptional activator SoxR [Ruegeria pomeroyi]HCE71090.1 redox-sensitive transcriptional activator SoxR [Ruegeria sp.]AAV93632.1 redox-sensitive transcriptional activator SoxR [Ruegeria pomeroyi DSS-3]NVK99360.1 redox-sensitive transcriptional activator SoxR [Ruegeria pomeroyi]NVL01258.1 redox-sensitive transcriptional activator SoxR [Ruegeria pomeroyi]QWV07222.1 redox-sensitive transcriptional activator SoxR [Ruegeria pomeroyi]